MDTTNLTAERVGREVRAQMARIGANQMSLAGALGMSQTAVSRRLRGEVPFSVTELELAAEHLGVPVVRFLAPPDAA